MESLSEINIIFIKLFALFFQNFCFIVISIYFLDKNLLSNFV